MKGVESYTGLHQSRFFDMHSGNLFLQVADGEYWNVKRKGRIRETWNTPTDWILWLYAIFESCSLNYVLSLFHLTMSRVWL